MIEWRDASREKPIAGKEVLMWVDGGEKHCGFWLKDANKYVKNIRKWKVYYGNHMIEENRVIAWVYIDDIK